MVFYIPYFNLKRIVILDFLLVFTVTYTRYRIDTINSHDDGHMAA
jgi:hypothetical protein